QKIVDECLKIDKEAEIAEKSISEELKAIEKSINDFTNKGYDTQKLDAVVEVNPSKREIADLDINIMVSFVEMASLSEEGYIAKKEDRLLKDVKKGSYRYFAEEDIIIAKITPCMENGKCAIATNLTNSIGFGSSEY